MATIELNDDEFDIYVLALRFHIHQADSYSITDWKARMVAIDALREVADEVGAHSIDTAELRACWDSRRIAPSYSETFTLTVDGSILAVALDALEEYGGELAGGIWKRLTA